MGNLVIVGTGDLAVLAFEYFSHDSDYSVVGYSVDEDHITETQLNGLPVVPFELLDSVFPASTHSCHVAVGNNWIRERFMFEATRQGYKLASYISKHAFVWPTVPIGQNTMIMEMNVVQPGATIGEGVYLSSGNHVGHHCVIGDLCFLASHVVLAGRCTIGRRTFAGLNSAVAENISIADDTYIAMGATVTKAVEDPGRILVGNPAVAASVSNYSYFDVKP